MPRRARMYIEGEPYHIVQRGNNREPCFIEPENYQFYLELWQQSGTIKGDGGIKKAATQDVLSYSKAGKTGVRTQILLIYSDS